MRAIGYIRVSTEEQAGQGHSLAMQPQRIRQWCELQGVALIDVIRDEGVSASVPLEKRVGGADLITRLRNREADVVVVYRLDRLFRDAFDGLHFFRNVSTPLGVAVHSISELIDTGTPHGKFNLTVQLGIAELERDLLSSRTKATINSMRERGKVYGTVPFGCVEVDGCLYRDPETWPHREFIVSLRRTPVGGRQLSLAQIAMVLRTQGISAPSGGREWSKTSVSRVVDTHDGLNHIPALPADHETAVSEAATE